MALTVPTINIVSEVKILLDERNLSDTLFNDEYHQNLDTLIQSCIIDAVQRVHMNAPFFLLETLSDFKQELDIECWEKDKEDAPYGYVKLPTDFMRLIAFKMSDWDKPAYRLLSPTDKLYSRQFCPFSGVTGNVHNPLCFLIEDSNGRSLQFFRCLDTTAEIEIASYIPKPAFDDKGKISICSMCYPSVLYTICSLVCTSVGRYDDAKAFDNLATSVLV